MTTTAPETYPTEKPTTVELVPAPVQSRWRPSRAGLISVWRYWDETFTFHDGRLLLRGPNGSGKSMALELLLPFLLDADTSPSRLTSATKSRGGLYERIMAGSDGQNRAGFAWVEFRRGPTDVFTIGARLRASAASRKVDAAFFTSSLAVGTDLHLLDHERVPLSRKALAAALGDRGQVHGSAAEYRSAIRACLFPGFSADRYASVITALLALRKEKLSQNLDLAKLSDTLTESLPPIDEADLATVAEGFERLDRRRDELTSLEAELVAVTALARRQRSYARTVAAGVATDVRVAETQRDTVTRAEREARHALDDAQRQDHETQTVLAALDDRLADIEAEIDARRTSKAYRKGAELNSVRIRERQLRERAIADQRAALERQAEEDRRQHDLEGANQDRQTAGANLDLASREVRQVAATLGVDHLVDEMAGADRIEAGQTFALAWVTGRRRQTRLVRDALGRHQEAVGQRGFREEQVAADQEALDHAGRHRASADETHRAAIDAYSQAVQGWAGSCRSLGRERVLLAVGARHFDPDAVAEACSGLRTGVESAHAAAGRELSLERERTEVERAVLVSEQADLEGGHLEQPAPPPWRGERRGRAGAPLWHLVEVADSATSAEIDGLETALDAAGFLDAWVDPKGQIDLVTEADVVLTRSPVAGRTLAQLLTPLPEAAVPPDVIAAVLSSVAIGAQVGVAPPGEDGPEVVMGTDGTFRLGAGAGRATVRPAVLLGAAARERRRLVRLAEVAVALAEVDEALARLDRRRDNLDRDRAATLAELDAVPSADALRAAVRGAEDAELRTVEAERRLETSQKRLREAEEAVREAVRSLTAVAAEHGLPARTEDLDRIDEALRQLEARVGTWASRAHQVESVGRLLAQAEQAHRRAASLRGEAEATWATSQRHAQDAAVTLATLEANVGVEFKEVLGQIAVLEAESRTKKSEHKGLQETRLGLGKRMGTLESTLVRAEQDRVDADARREEAHRRFVALVADDLAGDAGVELDGRLDGVTAVLAAAREIAATLEGVTSDDASVQRTSSQVDDRLHEARAALSGHADLSRELGDNRWWVLRAGVNGLRRPVVDLEASLRRTLDEGRAELAADEERLFEQTLAGSIRRSLATRIRQANQLVGAINEQLGVVRTAAAGVGVRLSWEVDPDQPAAVKAARALLLQDQVSDTERAALQDFVRARVDQARAELEHHAPWEARLRESLDYRAWHRFSLQVSHQDWEGFQPATSKRLQRLSTGERSIALHLPMLASIAAHYVDEAGRPASCPRLILLDELFAGVDTANRSKLFGTFTAWDLDAVFTSDHEWCQYASLSGIAIHHLHPPTGDEPLTSTRFTWDGHQRRVDPPAA